ncbi:hydrogen voltage-gated channel 1 [Purpureocillium lavendulum]|uniref:Voltage-gated hydrogen channel 1 n=1 Tax=Purpureocillium lavendulum TaxID=1247861 RepID=A0AB34FVF9_9HYPO|nr:hydrogen voltage-gated channel 1 [Purpureocillium lavendulum]
MPQSSNNDTLDERRRCWLATIRSHQQANAATDITLVENSMSDPESSAPLLHPTSHPRPPHSAGHYTHHHQQQQQQQQQRPLRQRHEHDGSEAAALSHDHYHDYDHDESGDGDLPGGHQEQQGGRLRARVARWRRVGRRLLDSRRKHFLVMAVVTLDVAALLANVFIQLIACEMHQRREPWVLAVTDALETAGLVFSSLFMLELAACLFSFGFSFFGSWFHIFDSAVIVLSFAIDVTSRGLTESIGSLVVVLRLWRLAKISEEVVMGATERMELLEQHLDDLESENKHLRDLLVHASHPND